MKMNMNDKYTTNLNALEQNVGIMTRVAYYDDYCEPVVFNGVIVGTQNPNTYIMTGSYDGKTELMSILLPVGRVISVNANE